MTIKQHHTIPPVHHQVPDSAQPSTSWLSRRQQKCSLLLPGIIAALVVAASASFLSEHYGAPVMLMALLLGMVLGFLSEEGRAVAGIRFTSSTILRGGVALLGMRITVEQILSLGGTLMAVVIGAVFLTISFGIILSRLLGQSRDFGILSGGSVGICGASAALAISAVLPPDKDSERNIIFTVISVTALSTIAMIAYPPFAQWIGLDAHQAGIFLGATIHDVAQVVGAGYSMSTETGDTATVVKLMRVAMLLPVIVTAAMITRMQGADPTGKRPPLLPWFAVGFLILACINSTGWIAPAVQGSVNELSRWCLVISISALGMKTRLRELAAVGIKPILLMVGETVFLVVLVLLLLRWGL